MCKGFHNLQKDEKMVDVTIAAGGKIFKAHKLVSNKFPIFCFNKNKIFISNSLISTMILGFVRLQSVFPKDFLGSSIFASDSIYDRCEQ